MEKFQLAPAAILPAPTTGRIPSIRHQYCRRAFIVTIVVTCFWLLSLSETRRFGQNAEIDWTPCFENQSVLCAVFGVPTNHDDHSEGVTRLSLTKVPALSTPSEKLGSIYTNPGGPGASGRWFCLQHGAQLRSLTGGKFDIICWDPRGIGRTTPNVNCHGSSLARRLALGTSPVIERTFEVPPEPDSEDGKALLIHQQREALRLMELQAKLCEQNVGADTLKWMGTTTLVRDIAYLKDHIDGETSLINFFGGSYGSIVADYLVNMLPSQVGKVIAYGVADPPTWSSEHYENYILLGEFLSDAEKTYSRWLDTIAANCDDVREVASSGQELGNKIDVMLMELWETGGATVVEGNLRGILTSGMIRSLLFATLQDPAVWRPIATALAKALQGDYLPISRLYFSPVPTRRPIPEPDGYIDNRQLDLARLAVSCADAPPYTANESWPSAETMVDNLLQHSRPVSHHFGLTVNLMEQHGGCQYWPQSSKPAPRFTGPWNNTLRTPMLVVSNTHDPVTPAAEGQKMSERFGKSARHVVQNRIGHSYQVEPTQCYGAIVKSYFEAGVVPDNDVFCDADLRWFPTG